ncbi:MAG: small ribosomal subunit Rsm22 family protein [Alphaproteobacteria bacterium]
MKLPSNLKLVLDSIISKSNTAEIIKAAANVSLRYRRLDNAQSLSIKSDIEAKAYLASRFPATFGAAASVLSELSQRLPKFFPQSLLDLGAGSGAMSCAAIENWQSLNEITLVEPNAFLQSLGQEVLKNSYSNINYDWQKITAQNLNIKKDYDLITANYVLNEIWQEQGEKTVLKTIEHLWQKTKNALIIVEPGTPQGQDVILATRNLLLKLGAEIAAPCPHKDDCPIAKNYNSSEKWCHFSVRIERSKVHRQIKSGANLSYEDEKFSYLIATREKAKSIKGRIVGNPRGGKVIQAETCNCDGTYKEIDISKSFPDYKLFKKSSWGDAF